MVFVNSIAIAIFASLLCATLCNGKAMYDDMDNGASGKLNYNVRNFIFPLTRATSEIYHKIGRKRGSVYSIARSHFC